MDERTWSVLDSFQKFMEEAVVVVQARQRDRTRASIYYTVTEHLGTAPQELPVVRLEVDCHQYVNLDVALAAVIDDHGGGRVLGVGGGDQRHHQTFGDMLQEPGTWLQFPVGAVDRVRLATGPHSHRDGVAYGIHLFRYAGTPVAVLERMTNPHYGHRPGLEVVAADGSPEVTDGLLADIRRLIVERSVFRGQVLEFGRTDEAYGSSVGGITFLDRPVMTAADVVLPDGALTRVERHVAGAVRRRAVLLAAGQHLKRGLLLYGPPGTGKTHTVRYLISQMPGITCIILAGNALGLLKTATDMAHALEPSVVVLEDIDLIAEHREMYMEPQPLLFTLLDAMDGLSSEADVAFVLTTNRADLLEAALAQRPGRVDLAVEVPLPDHDARRRLVRLYARGLPFTETALDEVATCTAGATASFFKELFRRTVLVAAEQEVPVTDASLQDALDEMLDERERMTRILLGHGAETVPAGPGRYGNHRDMDPDQPPHLIAGYGEV